MSIDRNFPSSQNTKIKTDVQTRIRHCMVNSEKIVGACRFLNVSNLYTIIAYFFLKQVIQIINAVKRKLI